MRLWFTSVGLGFYMWLQVRFHVGLDEFYMSLPTNDFMILRNFQRNIQRGFGLGFVLGPSPSKHLFLWE